MHILYDFLIRIAMTFLWLGQFFSKKLKLFVRGRKGVFETISTKIGDDDQTIWIHCASLGEFEQGVPLMKAIRKELPQFKIVLSFFSPSGYEIKKNSPLADVVVYLPLDTKQNARQFINTVHPSLVLFVKYEFWPNYLFELKNRNIHTLLISGVFRKDQIFFKPHGGFMRKALGCFDHYFVQDFDSEELLKKLNIKNITVAGDTRFDRVSQQIEQDNRLDFIEEFKQDSLCIVCGSTWPEDEAVLLDSFNMASEHVKFIIAPHKIDEDKIQELQKKLRPKTILYSKKEGENLSQFSILIVDTIGLLTKIYSYADIAYVGGAMGNTGLHNILEPATFEVPILIGKNYDRFSEAKHLRRLAGLFAVTNKNECSQIIKKLIEDNDYRTKTGMICGHYIKSNTGATQKTMDYILNLYDNSRI